MPTIINTIASIDWQLDKSAPAPMIFRRRSTVDGLLETRLSSVAATITDGTTTLSKSLGSGITLSTEETVTNSTVTLQLTSSDLSSFAVGNFATYELVEGSSDPKTLLAKGRLILE